MYKNILLLFVVISLHCAPAFSQRTVGQKPERNVPIVVSAAFNEQFPSKEPIWFGNYQGRYNEKLVYEGRFIFDNRYSAAMYDVDGNMLAFAAKVENNEIPAKALEYMNNQFPSFPILDAILVTTKKNEITYELGIMVENEYIIKVFSEKGEFIKSTRS